MTWFFIQFQRRLAEKAKDGLVLPVSNGEQKPVTKKRGRWDQAAPDENTIPVKKKATWDNAEVRLVHTS